MRRGRRLPGLGHLFDVWEGCALDDYEGCTTQRSHIHTCITLTPPNSGNMCLDNLPAKRSFIMRALHVPTAGKKQQAGQRGAALCEAAMPPCKNSP